LQASLESPLSIDLDRRVQRLLDARDAEDEEGYKALWRALEVGTKPMHTTLIDAGEDVEYWSAPGLIVPAPSAPKPPQLPAGTLPKMQRDYAACWNDLGHPPSGEQYRLWARGRVDDDGKPRYSLSQMENSVRGTLWDGGTPVTHPELDMRSKKPTGDRECTAEVLQRLVVEAGLEP